MTLVITTCTNRKRKPVPANLYMRSLPSSSLSDLAADWTSRLDAEIERFPAGEVYGGRGFREAAAAARALEGHFLIVSAGLGLIDATTKIPPYACTILVDAPDCVAARVIGGIAAPDWWTALSRISPFGVALHDAANDSSGLIFAALSDAYIEMISGELLALPLPILSRLRLFTRAPLERVASQLRPFVMPYDDRLDGPDSPVPGTRSDFAGRALRHFATVFMADGDARSAAEHAASVAEKISKWRFPEAPNRIRHDDAFILALIRSHWDDVGGCSLRRLRGEFNVACEQGRFRDLARIVRVERA